MSRLCRSLVGGASAAGLLLLGACTRGVPVDDFSNGGPPVAVTPAVTVDPSATDAAGTPPPTSGQSREGSPTSDAVSDDPPVAVVNIGDDEEYRVSSDEPVTVHCAGRGVVVVASPAPVTVTGVCGDVEVDAVGGTVTVETADQLQIDGHENQVTVDAVGSVDVQGDSNQVQAGQLASELELSGARNTVTFDSGSPEVKDEGIGNLVN